MQSETRETSGFDVAWAVWSRRKWLALLVFAGPFAAVVGLVMSLPNIYQSAATILVQHQQVPEAFVKTTVTGGLETRLQSISQEILSRSRLEELIVRFGLYPDVRKQVSPEAVIERMRRDIQLEPTVVVPGWRGGAITAFTVGYRGNNPQTVALVANTVASFYIEENLRVRERQAVGTAEFLRVQLEEVKQRLEEQERRVSEFNRRHFGELPQQMQANLATLERFNAQHRLNGDNQARASARREELVKQLAEADFFSELDSFGPARGSNPTAARVARLKQELAELRLRFSEKYPDVIQKKSEIAALEQQLGETKSDSEPAKNEGAAAGSFVFQLKQAISEVDAQLKVLKAEDQSLRRDMAAYQRRLDNTPRRDQEFQEMSRDYDTTRDLYRSLLKRYDEAQLAESLEQRQKGEQFRILDPAKAPTKPAAPNRLRLIIVGLMLSLGLAAGAVVITEQFDTSFHTLDELRAFSTIPVLVSIPPIVTVADARRRRWQFRIAAVAAMLGLALIMGGAFLVAHGNEELVRILPVGLS